MPTKIERRAPIDRVSVPTRTICTTTRCRSIGAKAEARTAAAKSEAASPSTWRRSRMPAPRRPTGPGRRGTRPTASTAMVVAPFEVPGADQPVPLARDEPPGHVPCAGAIRLGVPAVESVERRPQGEHPAVLRQHAVEERRHLSGPPPVNLDAPAHGEERREALAVPGGLVRLPLPPPQDQHGVVALVVEVLHVLAADAVGRPRVEARRDGRAVGTSIERGETPDAVLGLAEGALAIDERERTADPLVRLPLVHGVRVEEDAVEAAPAAGAVDGGDEREVDTRALPAVARHEPLAPDVKRPQDVARPLGAERLLAPVNGPEPEAAPGRSADGRDEREREEAALEPRLGEPEVCGEQDHADALEAVKVGHVEVEGQDAEVGPERGAGAVEDEGEELEAGRPRGRAGLRLGRRAVAVREEEEAEGLVAVPPAGRDEREEDVGLVVALPAALLAEPEQRADAEVTRLGRAGELQDRAERAPADDVVCLVVRVAKERPELHVEGARGTRERQETRDEEGRASRSATQDILGREPDARVLRRDHARLSCRGWRSQRGRRTRAFPRPPQTGPIANRYACAPRDLWNGACPFCRAGFASRGTAVARAASATCSRPCPRPKKSWVALLGFKHGFVDSDTRTA